MTVVDPGPPGSGRDALHILPRHDVAVRGRHIAGVLPTGAIPPAAARQVVDPPAGSALLPGLVNAHAHMAMVLFRGAAEDVPVESWFNEYIWPMESALTPDDVAWGARLAAIELLEGGVTTVADHYFAMDRIAEVVAESGLRAHLAWTMFGRDPVGELRQSEEFAQRWQGGAAGRITVWLGPHAPYTCPPPFLRQVAGAARRLGLGCHTHVAETASQVAWSLREHGMSPVRLLEAVGLMEGPLLCAHAVHVTDEEIRLLARRGAAVAHCPKTFLKLAAGIAPVVRMRCAGVTVALGTDGAASNNTLDLLEQMRLAALLQKHQGEDATALPVAEALALATCEGARALGQEGVLGQVAPGFLADLVVIRLDGAHVRPVHSVPAALVYAARASDVHAVVVDGRVVVEGGRIRTLDREVVLREVEARAQRLARREGRRPHQTYQA